MTSRVLGAAVVGVLLSVATLLPASAMAAPTPIPLTIGGSVAGTLGPLPASSIYVADYTFPMTAGQTVEITYTPSPAVTQPAMAAWSTFLAELWTGRNRLGQDPVSPQVLYLLAPQTTTYSVRVAGQSAPGTFTIDSAFVPPLSYSLSPISAPIYAVAKHSFVVTATLTGTLDQFFNPVRFIVQRKVGRAWRPYASVEPALGGSDYSATVVLSSSLKLPRGSFRVRAVFRDAAHTRGIYDAWKTITVGAVYLTALPKGMTPRVALTTYCQDVMDKKYAEAFALLPPAQQRSYGSASAYGEQVGSYDIYAYKLGPSRRSGSTVRIVVRQSTPAMDITYTWTYVKVGGAWFVKSRTMGGRL